MGSPPGNHGQLESWKEIARYLGRSVRTVIRWEQSEGLPVYRHIHEKKPSVYAISAEIDQWWASRGAKLDTPESTRSTPVSAVRTRWALTFAALLAFAGTLAYLLLRVPSTPPPSIRPEVVTSYPGPQSLPALSPDASLLAFSWHGPDVQPNIDIYVQAIGSTEPKRLTESPDVEFSAAWSPDGKWIASLRRTNEGEVFVEILPVLGGRARTLIKLGAYLMMDATQISWSPDGNWLVVPDKRDGKQGLFLLSVLDGTEHRLTASSGTYGHQDPQCSPDGRHLVFRCKNVEHSSEICILRLDDSFRAAGTPEVITNLGLRATSPVWSSDGLSILFSAGYFLSDSALYRMKVFPHRARMIPPEKLVPEAGEQYGLSRSRRGGVLAFTRRQDDVNLWAVERQGGIWKPARMLSVLASNRIERSPDLSPDAKCLAFTSNRHGTMELWLANFDGTNIRKVPQFAGKTVWAARWAPDGRSLAVSTGQAGGNLYVVQEGGPPRKLSHEAFDPYWSPDGDWIYFFHKYLEPTGIFKIRPNGQDESRVLDHIGGRLALSRDGNSLYWSQSDGIWRIPLQGRRTEELVIPGSFWGFVVGPDGIFTSSRSRLLQFHPFNGAAPVILAQLGDPYSSFTVSNDGNTVVYSSIDNTRTNLMLLRGL